jgi:hypothetical protein
MRPLPFLRPLLAPFGMLSVMTLAACGGGGGGGGNDGPAPLPLSTNVLATTPASIQYTVTGTYTDALGARAVSGSITSGPIAPQSLNGYTWFDCAEAYANLTVGGIPRTGTSRVYGEMRPQEGWLVEGGRRLADGTDIYWEPLLAGAPHTLDVGESWDLNATASSTSTGYDATTDAPRLWLAEYRWQVEGIAAIQVPAGWYECYVVSLHEMILDNLTGIWTTLDATTYVRPEFGMLYSVSTETYEDGVSTATLVLTASATSIVP